MMVKVETNERRIGRKPVSRHRKVLIGPTNTDIYIYIHTPLRIRIRIRFSSGSGSGIQIYLDPGSDPVKPRFRNKKIAERSLKVIYQKKT